MKKRRIFILLAATMTAVGAFSQTKIVLDGADGAADRSYRINVGPVVGLTYSSLSEGLKGLDMGTKSSIGFEIGAEANARFGRKTEVSSGGTGLFGVYAAAKFAKHSVKTDGSDNFGFSFLEIPILFQVYPMSSLAIEAGPTLALSMSSSPDKMVFRGSTTITSKDLKPNDVRLTIGARYMLDNGMNVGLHYNIGTSDAAENFPCKLSGLEISVGWLFNIIK